MQPTVNDVRTMLSDVQSVTDEQAQTALDVAHAVVDAYVRGVSRAPGGDYRPGVGEIVLALAVRLAANPTGASWQESAGAFSRSRGAGVRGLLLHERLTLDRYRRTATAR